MHISESIAVLFYRVPFSESSTDELYYQPMDLLQHTERRGGYGTIKGKKKQKQTKNKLHVWKVKVIICKTNFTLVHTIIVGCCYYTQEMLALTIALLWKLKTKNLSCAVCEPAGTIIIPPNHIAHEFTKKKSTVHKSSHFRTLWQETAACT